MPQQQAAALPTEPFVVALSEATFHALLLDAFQIANEAVIADIESESHPVDVDGRRWWDTRPMLDENRHPAEFIALNSKAITYAISAALVGIHPQRPYLIHILNQA